MSSTAVLIEWVGFGLGAVALAIALFAWREYRRVQRAGATGAPDHGPRLDGDSDDDDDDDTGHRGALDDTDCFFDSDDDEAARAIRRLMFSRDGYPEPYWGDGIGGDATESARSAKARDKLGRATPPAQAARTMLTIELVGRDVSVQLLESQTVMHLVEALSEHFLRVERAGDSGPLDHAWSLADPGTRRRYDGPHDVHGDSDNNRLLADLRLREGRKLGFTYDMGNTTHIRLLVTERESAVPADVAASCPRRVPPEGEPAHFAPHVPPPGTPTLDRLFPELAALAMDERIVASAFFPMGANFGCGAFLEPGGPMAMTDSIFAPFAWTTGGAEEMLLALEMGAARAVPDDTRFHAFGRFCCAVALDGDNEAAYRRASARPDDPFGPRTVWVRPTHSEYEGGIKRLRDAGFDFATAFPKCAAACSAEPATWIYRRGDVVRVCSGPAAMDDPKDTSISPTSVRGMPDEAKGGRVLGKITRRVGSLHQLFCVAEALLP